MTQIPTSQDWAENPEKALADSLEIAKTTAAHGDATSTGIALGVASRVVRALAPAIGSAVGGPMGALAGAAVVQVADALNQEHALAVKALSPAQVALIDQAIAIGVQAATKKATP